jgi:EVE domain
VPDISYWLDVFSHKTWSEFLQAGGTVSGFRESRWKTAQRINPGDYFLCYLTGVSRWIGLLKVTGKAYRDEAPIWEDDPFPVRFPVKVLIALRPETAVPIIEMRDRLSIFKDLANPHAWTGRLRGSPQNGPRRTASLSSRP